MRTCAAQLTGTLKLTFAIFNAKFVSVMGISYFRVRALGSGYGKGAGGWTVGGGRT